MTHARRTGASPGSTFEDADRAGEPRARSLQAALGGRLALISRSDDELARVRLAALLAGATFGPEDRIELLMGGWGAPPIGLEGLTDIDALVLLEVADSPDIGPVAMLDAFTARLRAGLAADPEVTGVATGVRSVTVHYRDGGHVRLLPAQRIGDDVRMADHAGAGWFGIGAAFFASELVAANARLDGGLVPVIRLAKLAIAGQPEMTLLTGYHVETLAIAVFRGYAGGLTAATLLRHYFSAAAQAVLRPLVNSAGQSLHIDDALGSPESAERRLIAASLAQAGRRMAEAGSVEEWLDLVPEPPD